MSSASRIEPEEAAAERADPKGAGVVELERVDTGAGQHRAVEPGNVGRPGCRGVARQPQQAAVRPDPEIAARVLAQREHSSRRSDRFEPDAFEVRLPGPSPIQAADFVHSRAAARTDPERPILGLEHAHDRVLIQAPRVTRVVREHVETNSPWVEAAQSRLPAAGPDGTGAIAQHAHHRARRDAAAAARIVAKQAETR